jgi:regulator of PEP synthase PpsR (kinase-PPPase family)
MAEESERSHIVYIVLDATGGTVRRVVKVTNKSIEECAAEIIALQDRRIGEPT